MSRPAIDLRSDTVTRPTAAMRRAMAEAEVGDDVYGEDPTVNRLQDMVAEMAGMEAGLFVPSGTMGNQVAIAVHTDRGQEVVMPEGAHVYEYEPGAMAVLSGALPRFVKAPRGAPDPADVAAVIRGPGHQAATGLVVLENTHNVAGGTVVPPTVVAEVQRIARSHGLPIHLDGARAFNAAAAMGVGVDAVCAGFDTVSLCLSKGLGAPVGTVLVGSREHVAEAHRYRKLLGGGMRQAGVLAAAGIVAVTEGPARLVDDHRRARRLAEGLAALPGVQVDLEAVQTNIVYFEVEGAAAFAARCAELGVLLNAMGAKRCRVVTHFQVTDEDVDAALTVLGRVASERAQAAA
jgi:threonine aldolase